jgi:hypothetical protein
VEMNVGGRGASSYDPQVGEWKREEMKMCTFSRFNRKLKIKHRACFVEQSRAKQINIGNEAVKDSWEQAMDLSVRVARGF